jgi:(4S)-4-hydroxy-5-phosphonooxypentane-2,3-dione isomerase
LSLTRKEYTVFVVRIDMKLNPSQQEAFHQFVDKGGLEPRRLSGCSNYVFCQAVEDPTRVLLYEEWDTRAQFEAYKNSALFKMANESLRPLLAQPPSSAYYESDDRFASCAVPRNDGGRA